MALCAGGNNLENLETLTYHWTPKCKVRVTTFLVINNTVDRSHPVRLRFPVLSFELSGDNEDISDCDSFTSTLNAAQTFRCFVETTDAPAGTTVNGYRSVPDMSGWYTFLGMVVIGWLIWVGMLLVYHGIYEDYQDQ